MAIGIGAAIVTACGAVATAGIGAIVAAAINGLIIGAVVGAIGAAITGGDILQGALFGAVGGAITGGLGAAFSGAGTAVQTSTQQAVQGAATQTAYSGTEVALQTGKEVLKEGAKKTIAESAKGWVATHGAEVAMKGVAAGFDYLQKSKGAKDLREHELSVMQQQFENEKGLQDNATVNRLKEIEASKGGGGGSGGGGGGSTNHDALIAQREKFVHDDKIAADLLSRQTQAAGLRTTGAALPGATNTREDSQANIMDPGNVQAMAAPEAQAVAVPVQAQAIPQEEVV